MMVALQEMNPASSLDGERSKRAELDRKQPRGETRGSSSANTAAAERKFTGILT